VGVVGRGVLAAFLVSGPPEARFRLNRGRSGAGGPDLMQEAFELVVELVRMFLSGLLKLGTSDAVTRLGRDPEDFVGDLLHGLVDHLGEHPGSALIKMYGVLEDLLDVAS